MFVMTELCEQARMRDMLMCGMEEKWSGCARAAQMLQRFHGM
jgi:hypothetical protein